MQHPISRPSSNASNENICPISLDKIPINKAFDVCADRVVYSVNNLYKYYEYLKNKKEPLNYPHSRTPIDVKRLERALEASQLKQQGQRKETNNKRCVNGKILIIEFNDGLPTIIEKSRQGFLKNDIFRVCVDPTVYNVDELYKYIQFLRNNGKTLVYPHTKMAIPEDDIKRIENMYRYSNTLDLFDDALKFESIKDFNDLQYVTIVNENKEVEVLSEFIIKHATEFYKVIQEQKNISQYWGDSELDLDLSKLVFEKKNKIAASYLAISTAKEVGKTEGGKMDWYEAEIFFVIDIVYDKTVRYAACKFLYSRGYGYDKAPIIGAQEMVIHKDFYRCRDSIVEENDDVAVWYTYKNINFKFDPPMQEQEGGGRYKYKNRNYVIRKGARGGKYIMVKGKKVYV